MVAPQGTAFTEGQARILKRYVSEVVLCFDADAAGRKSRRAFARAAPGEQSRRPRRGDAAGGRSRFVSPEGRRGEVSARGSRRRAIFSITGSSAQVSPADLANLSAKMQIARELAETVGARARPAHAQRSDQQSLRPARGGRGGFRRAPARSRSAPARLPTDRRAPSRPRRGTRSRCSACSPCAMPTRAIFSSRRNGREVMEETPGTRNAGANSRRASCGPTIRLRSIFSSPRSRREEESLVSGWLLQKMPPNAETVARDWWQGLRQPALRRRLQAAESRLKLPRLNRGRGRRPAETSG